MSTTETTATVAEHRAAAVRQRWATYFAMQKAEAAFAKAEAEVEAAHAARAAARFARAEACRAYEAAEAEIDRIAAATSRPFMPRMK